MNRVVRIQRLHWLPSLIVAGVLGLTAALIVYSVTIVVFFRALPPDGGIVQIIFACSFVAAMSVAPGYVGVNIYLALRWKRIVGPWCNCGYNLTGNVSGVCPECGQGIREKTSCSVDG